MPFHSFGYLLLFLPVVAAGNAALDRHAGRRFAQAWLLGASLFFYVYAEPRHAPLLAGSIVFNWLIARGMTRQREERRRAWILRAGLAANIAFLCTFKYANFFLRAMTPLGLHWELPDWGFPLGVSFFTLTQVMYLVDTYQGLNDAYSLFDHATLVALFPYVASGPLVRARSVIPQFRRFAFPENRLDLACRGFYLLAVGLAKKVVLADSFAAIADVGFGSARNFSTAEAWVFSLAYTFQIYFDFSGYSDMAVGSAWMLGIDIPQNFNAPFRSKSISEFWQRWHISLSNFITNYLYTPMLRSMGRASLGTSTIAILLAMAIAGLWHGPAWTFIVFGVLHGAGLAVNQFWRKRKYKMPGWLGVALTFGFVNITFVFFRSPGIGPALHLLSRMLPHANLFGVAALKGVVPFSPTLLLRPVSVGVAAAFLFQTSAELAKAFRPNLSTAGATAALILVSLFFMNSTVVKQFVYFAF